MKSSENMTCVYHALRLLSVGNQAMPHATDEAAPIEEIGPRPMLLDIKLPKVDGIEVLRRIKADERARTIPVVMPTSSQEERDIVESYRLCVNSYIVKPVEFDKFVETVTQVGLY